MDIVKKIDLHIHLIPERDVLRFDGTTYATPVEVREFYDSIGVEKGVLLSMPAHSSHTDTISMREARKMAEDFPKQSPDGFAIFRLQ